MNFINELSSGKAKVFPFHFGSEIRNLGFGGLQYLG
jgi:hypothetical protein